MVPLHGEQWNASKQFRKQWERRSHSSHTTLNPGFMCRQCSVFVVYKTVCASLADIEN